MLQITTGKLFTEPVGRENLLRGVLYTNLSFGRDNAIQSPLFGSIVQSSELSNSPRVLVYEFTERIEGNATGPGALVSHGADAFLREMSTLISFWFGCICSPDIDLVRRLTSGQRGPANLVPKRYIQKIFDGERWVQPHEIEPFVAFVNHLLGLQRKSYLRVMRAIRSYVTGLHRVADDLGLAYTLLVASGELLSQRYKAQVPKWDDVSDQKRVPIDAALNDAPPEIAKRVRQAVLDSEHTALSRRFKTFVAENISPDFFCRALDKHTHPPGRGEISEVLESAYQIRSKYVHEMEPLPGILEWGDLGCETTIVDRQRTLTLEGLSTLTRHVIVNFVGRQPTVEREAYDYRREGEEAGIVTAQLAPSYWVHIADGDISGQGRIKLEGFLQELSAYMLDHSSKITDIHLVLKKFLELAPSMKAAQRLPYLALTALFNAIAGEKAVALSKTSTRLIDQELGKASIESILVCAILRGISDWSIETYLSTFNEYKRQRKNKNGIRYPRLFEAAIALDIAERYRAAGEIEQCKALVTEAADDYPDHVELRSFADSLQTEEPIIWNDVLLPRQNSPSE